MPGTTEGSTSQWLVSVRGGGEVLTAEVTENETRLLVLTTVPGRTRRELEGRLHDIHEVAAAGTLADLGPRPIPGPVHHAIEAVIQWRTELLRAFPECELCALLFHQSQRDVAFGFVGGLAPVVIIDGEPWPGPWIPYSSRSTASPAGRGKQPPRNRRAIESLPPATPESQAFSMYAGRRLRLDLTWSADLRAHGGHQISIDVGWVGLGIDARALDHEVPSLQVEPALETVGLSTADSANAATEGGEWVGASEAENAIVSGAVPTPGVGEVRESVADVTRANPFFQWLDAIATQGANPPARPGAPHLPERTRPHDAASDSRGASAAGAREENTFSIPRLPSHLSATAPATSPAPASPAPPASHPAPLPPVPTVAAQSVPTASHPMPPPAAHAPVVSADVATLAAEPAPHEYLAPAVVQESAAVSSAAAAHEDQDSVTAVADPPDAGFDSGTVAADSVAGIEPEASRPTSPLEDLGASEPAAPIPAPGTGVRRPRRLVVSEPASTGPRPSFVKRAWPWAAAVAVLFAAGWYLGRMPAEPDPAAGPSAIVRALRVVGLGGRWFVLDVTSEPEGAWIAVDGKEVGRRTPARLELTPGSHTVTLSIPDHGHVDYTVNGVHQSRVPLAGVLLGTLIVTTPNRAIPIAVAVDGTPRGYAPVRLEGMAPGPHEVAFSGPGMDPWAQTVDIEPNQDFEIVARPFESPATGVVEVRARLIDEEGQEPVKGAPVWVDGERMGVTPLTLELPRGPHSVRVAYRDERAPVQVIDLPGGNQRFADFDFGTGAFRPTLTLTTSAGPMSLEKTNLVSATLQGVMQGEVREMWLHVRTPERTWKRFPMTTLHEAGGIVGVVPFPPALLDEKGRATFYVSALTTLGDEYFTELQNAEKPSLRKKSVPLE